MPPSVFSFKISQHLVVVLMMVKRGIFCDDYKDLHYIARSGCGLGHKRHKRVVTKMLNSAVISNTHGYNKTKSGYRICFHLFVSVHRKKLRKHVAKITMMGKLSCLSCLSHQSEMSKGEAVIC